jgi:hypothetical protein
MTQIDPESRGEWVLLSLCLPGKRAKPLGVFLRQTAGDLGFVRIRKDLASISPAVIAAIYGDLANDIGNLAQRLGAGEVLRWFTDSLSNIIQVSDICQISMSDPELAIDQLFSRHVKPNGTSAPKHTAAKREVQRSLCVPNEMTEFALPVRGRQARAARH